MTLTIILVREAGSSHCGKPSKHSTKLRAATWNEGNLKSRSIELVEKLSRRSVDVCGVQEHRWQCRLVIGFMAMWIMAVV